jgi:hypothetical protein
MMLFETFIATFGLLMPLVLAAPVSEDNQTLVNFTSHLRSRGLITAENTCPKSETCRVISYTGDRVVNLLAGECGVLPESENALSVYVGNCYCSFWEYVNPSIFFTLMNANMSHQDMRQRKPEEQQACCCPDDVPAAAHDRHVQEQEEAEVLLLRSVLGSCRPDSLSDRAISVNYFAVLHGSGSREVVASVPVGSVY